MNVVSLIGNLATDVEFKEVGSDNKKMAGFLLAVDRPGKDADADFVWVKAWERQAELCAQYLHKGRAVYAEGRLRTHKWEDTAGQKRSRTEVILDELKFVGAKPQEVAA